MTPIEIYNAAHAEFKLAAAEFHAIREGFRGGCISDEHFLAARRAIDAAHAKFDAAEATYVAWLTLPQESK